MTQPSSQHKPPALRPEAYHGPAGAFVRQIEPDTESDPASILIQHLGAVGSAAGPSVGFTVNRTWHPMLINVMIVGPTGTGRKGGSATNALWPLRLANPHWHEHCISAGVSTGEGLIQHVRDPVIVMEEVEDETTLTGTDTRPKVTDPGATDKRACIVLSEATLLLKNIEKPGSLLSETVRDLWDKQSAQTLTKHDPIRTTGAHVNIMAQVTPRAVQDYLASAEIANGFANRFLFAWSPATTKRLPRGGSLTDIDIAPYVSHLKDVFRWASARDHVELDFTRAAGSLWDGEMYDELNAQVPGILGELLARGAPYVRRLATVYALIDMEEQISLDHLQAARAVWEYCAESAAHIWGTRTGDDLADKLYDMLIESNHGGMTRAEIRRQLKNNRITGDTITTRLHMLRDLRRADCEIEYHDQGRPTERWWAISENGSAPASDAPQPTSIAAARARKKLEHAKINSRRIRRQGD